MRKIDTLFIIATMLFMPLLISATERGGLEFNFANVQVQQIDGSSYLNLDVMVKGNNAIDRLGTGIVLINYNSAVFGYRVNNQNNLIVSKGTLLSGNPASYYNLYLADSLPTRLAVTYEYFYPQGYGSIVSTEFQQLLNIKIKIQNYGLPAGIGFHSTGMSNQQYLDDNASIFAPVTSIASIPDLIPATPEIISVSWENAQITLTWEEIPNCTYNIFSAASPYSDIWICEADNISNNYWTEFQSSDKRFYVVTANSNVNYGSRRNEIGK